MKRLALLFVLLPTIAIAGHGHGHCQQFFYGHAQKVVAVKVPIYYHAVAPQVSAAASYRAERAPDPLYSEYLQDRADFELFKAFKAGQRAAAAGVQAQQANRVPIIEANCASCHGPLNGRLHLGADATIEPDKITKAMRWLSGTSEPPPEMKSVIEKLIRDKQQGAVIQELLSLEGESQ